MWGKSRTKYGLFMHITGVRGNSGVEPEVRCMGETGFKNGAKDEEEDKTAVISYDRIATDDGDNFFSAFGEDSHEAGEKHTAGIEGNNCRLRHRIRIVCVVGIILNKCFMPAMRGTKCLILKSKRRAGCLI
jgi:hypothetical protein